MLIQREHRRSPPPPPLPLLLLLRRSLFFFFSYVDEQELGSDFPSHRDFSPSRLNANGIRDRECKGRHQQPVYTPTRCAKQPGEFCGSRNSRARASVNRAVTGIPDPLDEHSQHLIRLRIKWESTSRLDVRFNFSIVTGIYTYMYTCTYIYVYNLTSQFYVRPDHRLCAYPRQCSRGEDDIRSTLR